MSSSSMTDKETGSAPLPPAPPPLPTLPKTRAPPPPPPAAAAKPPPITHAHNIISSTSIAKKVSQCLEQLFPDPPAPVRRIRTTTGASAASASSAKKPKPQIIITLTAKSVSAPKAVTICEILKRRIAEQGRYWYQYCALEEVLEEVKPKRPEPKGVPQRDTTRRSSWAGPPPANSPSKPLNKSPLHSPAKPPKMAPLTAPPAPGRSFSVSSNSPVRAPSRLTARNSARSLRGGRAETPVEPTVDEEDPFGPFPPPPKRTQNDPPVTRAMPVLTIYLSTQRIDDYKERHGEQSNEPSPYNVPLPKEPNKKKK